MNDAPPPSDPKAQASGLLAVPVPSVRERLVAAARSCIGTRFLHQGRVRGVGLDCAGLLLYCAADVGLPHRDFPNRNYSRWPTLGRKLIDFVESQTVPVPVDALKPGTLLLFWCYKPTLPQHLAIVSGVGTIVHAWYDAGAVVETPLLEWRDKIVGAYEFHGTE